MNNVRVVILLNHQVLISQIEEIGSELGEPDCKLILPYEIKGTVLEPWNSDYTTQKEFKIHSDKILTILEYPKEQILEKYLNLIKE